MPCALQANADTGTTQCQFYQVFSPCLTWVTVFPSSRHLPSNPKRGLCSLGFLLWLNPPLLVPNSL